jgi:hypothetical protein
MRWTNRRGLLLLVACTALSSCEDRPEQPAAAEDASVPADAIAPDVDARVLSDIAVSVLPDPDDPPEPVRATPSEERIFTRDGTALTLASEREVRARMQLAQEIGEMVSVPVADLRELRLHWFTRGSGIIFQNPTTHTFRLSVHFESSSDPECQETVLRGRITAKSSVAPFATRADCAYDTALVTLFDRYNFVVADATLRPD